MTAAALSLKPELALLALSVVGAPSLAQCVEIASTASGMSVRAIHGRGRGAGEVKARQIACYLARRYTDASFPTIARDMGGFDPSAILYHDRRVRAVIAAIGEPPIDKPVEVAAWLWFRRWPSPSELRANRPSYPTETGQGR